MKMAAKNIQQNDDRILMGNDNNGGDTEIIDDYGISAARLTEIQFQ